THAAKVSRFTFDLHAQGSVKGSGPAPPGVQTRKSPGRRSSGIRPGACRVFSRRSGPRGPATRGARPIVGAIRPRLSSAPRPPVARPGGSTDAQPDRRAAPLRVAGRGQVRGAALPRIAQSPATPRRAPPRPHRPARRLPVRPHDAAREPGAEEARRGRHLLRQRRAADEAAARLGNADRAAERGLRRPDALPPPGAGLGRRVAARALRPRARVRRRERFDRGRVKVGATPARGALRDARRQELAAALEREAAELLRDKNAGVPDSLAGRTVVIEAARGGPDGASMPLPAPLGYGYSIARLSDEILSRAAIIYVWVTPEASRRKNHERTDPDDPGSILYHGVPHAVMLGDYGCDDMDWLIGQSDRMDTVRIETRGKTFHIPVARFDNRVDKTTFVRGERAAWKPAAVAALHAGLAEALERLSRARATARERPAPSRPPYAPAS